MGNKATIDRDEKIFNALFDIAADEALREEMDNLPSCEELNANFPRTKSLDKKVFAVIDREFGLVKRKNTLPTFARIAAIFCVFIVVSVGALMSVEASRNFILNFLIDIRGEYVAFDFGLSDSHVIDSGEIVLGYKPEGFELVSNHALYNMAFYVYMDDIGNQIIVQWIIGTHFVGGVDYEYMEISEILINGLLAYKFIPIDEHGESKIIWTLREYVISVTTTLDSETLVKIAENLLVR